MAPTRASTAPTSASSSFWTTRVVYRMTILSRDEIMAICRMHSTQYRPNATQAKVASRPDAKMASDGLKYDTPLPHRSLKVNWRQSFHGPKYPWSSKPGVRLRNRPHTGSPTAVALSAKHANPRQVTMAA
uniref:(northern house mosquito) hypothetical protein n=1 Tax=Culex pipiens TaxID=7175 RepID=A0A8D8K8J6_CULPI